MKLVKLFTIFEAGDVNRQAEVPGKKRRVFKPSNKYAGAKLQTPDQQKAFDSSPELAKFLGGSNKMSLDDYPDDDDDWADEDEKHAAAWGDDEDDLGDDGRPMPPAPSRYSKPEPEEKPAEKPIPFSSKSEPPSKSMQGGRTAANVKADPATLKALAKALNAVRTSDDDLQDWIDDVIREIERANKSGSDLSLPKFEATPDLDDLDDDGGSDDDEEEF